MCRSFPPPIKFGMVGLLNTGVDFAVFTLLTYWGWAYPLAQAVSFTSGVLNSYVLNRSWTFPGSGGSTRRSLLRFVILNGLVLLLTWGVIALLHQGAGRPLLFSKLCANGIAVLVNYTGNRIWVFHPGKSCERSARS